MIGSCVSSKLHKWNLLDSPFEKTAPVGKSEETAPPEPLGARIHCSGVTGRSETMFCCTWLGQALENIVFCCTLLNWALENIVFCCTLLNWALANIVFCPLGSTGRSKTQGLTHYARQHFENTFEVTFEVTGLLRTHFVRLHRRRHSIWKYIHACLYVYIISQFVRSYFCVCRYWYIYVYIYIYICIYVCVYVYIYI